MIDVDQTSEAAQARAEFYADTIGVEPPASVVDDSDCLTQEIIDLCRQYGASLDWIFCGDVRGMIRDSYARAQGLK